MAGGFAATVKHLIPGGFGSAAEEVFVRGGYGLTGGALSGTANNAAGRVKNAE
jgi:hypothetical protein